jgi:NitT/TauT family transport system ATP-binding protein
VLLVTHDLEEAISLSDEVILLSAGPASRIIGRFPIEIDRPRELLDLRTDSRFRAVYDEIWGQLRAEVVASYEQCL